MATNMSGSYFSKSHTCHIISSLLQHVLKMSASSTNASVDAAPLDNSTFNNHVTKSGPLAVYASFQFVDVLKILVQTRF